MSNKIECVCCPGAGEHTCSTCNGEGKLTCPDCNGKGTTFSICPDCHEGRVLDPMGEEDDDTMPCPTCHGNYKTESGKCKTCGGSGKVECKNCEGKGKEFCELCDGDGEIDVEAFCADYFSDEIRADEVFLVCDGDVAPFNKMTFAQLVEMADAEYVQACYIVGSCYDTGAWADDDGRLDPMMEDAEGRLRPIKDDGLIKIADKDLVKAEKYYRVCADKGSVATQGELEQILTVAAQEKLGLMLLREGQSGARRREGVEWLQKAAEHSHEKALLVMAFISLGGVPGVEGLKTNSEKALSYFKRYIECDPWGPETIEMVKAYIEKLPKAVGGDTVAMMELAKFHERSVYDESSAKDVTGGFTDLRCYWLEKAAAAGNVEAIRTLAEKKESESLVEAISMLSKVAKDDEKAKQQMDAIMQRCTSKQSRFDELKEVGKAGNVTVMKFIAKQYMDGVVGKNEETRLVRATKWMQMAADAGDAESKLDLAPRYRDGKGCEIDINKSFVLTYEGFNAGRKKRALRIFAELYRWGKFAEPDHKKANELYVMSANAGYAAAICCIGVSYRDGLGVRKDLSEAKRLFELAIEKGSKDAAKELKKIPAEIKPSKKPISGVTAAGKSVKDPLPGFVESDYKKAKEGKLWNPELVQKKKDGKSGVAGNSTPSQKKRWKFVLIGLFLGVLGLHFLYARRKGWFVFYWLMFVANLAQAKIQAVKEFLAGFSPTLATAPIFTLMAAVILIGSIFFMKKDGDGNRM